MIVVLAGLLAAKKLGRMRKVGAGKKVGLSDKFHVARRKVMTKTLAESLPFN